MNFPAQKTLFLLFRINTETKWVMVMSRRGSKQKLDSNDAREKVSGKHLSGFGRTFDSFSFLPSPHPARRSRTPGHSRARGLWNFRSRPRHDDDVKVKPRTRLEKSRAERKSDAWSLSRPSRDTKGSAISASLDDFLCVFLASSALLGGNNLSHRRIMEKSFLVPPLTTSVAEQKKKGEEHLHFRSVICVRRLA
jgi:hypothetical protein